MASHKSVMHIQRGFRMAKSYAEQVMRDHCSITWVVEGQTIRDTTDEERIALRAEQAELSRMRSEGEEILESSEISGFTFVRPKTTNYRGPGREAYEELAAPLAYRSCRWPRPMHQVA